MMLADMVPFNTKMQQRASNSLHNLTATTETMAVCRGNSFFSLIHRRGLMSAAAFVFLS